MDYLTSCVFCVFFKFFLLLCINMSFRRHRKGRIGALMDNVMDYLTSCVFCVFLIFFTTVD